MQKTNLFVDLKICKQNIRAVDSGCMREALAKVKLKFMQAINALNVESEKERERVHRMFICRMHFAAHNLIFFLPTSLHILQ